MWRSREKVEEGTFETLLAEGRHAAAPACGASGATPSSSRDIKQIRQSFHYPALTHIRGSMHCVTKWRTVTIYTKLS